MQKQSLATSLEKHKSAPVSSAYHQKLSQRESKYTWKDIDKYAIIPGLIMLIFNTLLGYLLTFILHPAVATILAGITLSLMFIYYLRFRNRKRVAEEIYNEQEQDINTLIDERPLLIKEIRELSVYQNRLKTLRGKCDSSFLELPDKQKKEEKEIQREVATYFDEKDREYLKDIKPDAHRIEFTVNLIENCIRALSQPPRLVSRKSTNQN